MQLRGEQLETDLARGLRPLYVIHGDEPLLALEAADAVRATARAGGYTERDVLLVERGFEWSQLAMSAAGMSLFGEKKLIELRIPTGKPGTDGALLMEIFTHDGIGTMVVDEKLESLREAVADRLQPLTFMDLDWRIVNRQLEREAATRRSGPIAENLLRDIGTVASKVS